MGFDSETAFESALIKCLVEEKGWKDGVIKYPTEKDLLDNWAKIIFENNRDIDRLGDFPMTDGEMAQIMGQIAKLRTPLNLNGLLMAELCRLSVTTKMTRTISRRRYRSKSLTAMK